MKNSGFIFCLLIAVVVLNGCFPDLGCIFEFPENKNELSLMEIIYDDGFSKIEVLRTNEFMGEGTNIPYEYEFSRFHHSFNGMISYFWNGKKGFMNYGPEKKVFSQPMVISHPSFLSNISSPHRSAFDYQLNSNTSIYHDYESHKAENPFNGDTVNTAMSSLYKFDHNLKNTEMLLRYGPIFLDSSTYKITRTFDQRYTFDNEILVVAGDVTFNLQYDEDLDYYYSIDKSRQMYLFKLNEDLSLDTLFTVPDDESQFPYLESYISAERILLTNGGNTYQFNKSNRELKFLYEGSTPQNMAIDDLSLTFDKGTKYYSFLENEVIDLSDYFNDIKYSIPYKNLVAVQVYSAPDKLYVINLDSKSVINTISSDELPEFNSVSGNSSFRIENPVFTKDGDLIFMHIRQTYLEDEEYEARCG